MSDTIDPETSIKNEANTIASMYNQLNNIFGGSQMFVLEYPTRVLNQLDYAYNIDNFYDSSLLKPYVVAENEFKLADNLMDLAPIVQGPNGKKLSTEYQTVLNNYAPKIDDITGFITDKMELRLFLLEKITDTIGDKEYTCSRLEFCQKLYLYYLEQKAQWDQEKFERNKKAEEENTLDEYASWLSVTAWTKDKQLEALFNDAIVRGFYHEIMTILGFIDVASPAERLENAKTNLRTSVRRRTDGSGEIYPVSFSPSNWFRGLTPNYSPKDLLTNPDFLLQQYFQKKNALESLKAELSALYAKQTNSIDVEKIKQEMEASKEELSNLEKEAFKTYSESQVQIAKLALQVASKGNMAGFLAGKNADAVVGKLNIDAIAKTMGLDVSEDQKASSEGLVSGLMTSMVNLYSNHIDYFSTYQKLMDCELAEVQCKTNDDTEMINLLKERITLLSNEISQLEIILSSGFLNADENATLNSTGDSFPVNKYDEDGMFSEIVISHKKDASQVSTEDGSVSANLSGSIGHFLWSASANANYASSTHQFSQKASNSDIEIGMRVMKVSIERGGWFDPGIIDISSSYMHIRPNMKASVGLNVDKLMNSKDPKKLSAESVLPGFPSSFLVAKDIHIKMSNQTWSQEEVNSFEKASLTGSTSICGIRLSGNVATEKTRNSANNNNDFDSLTIKIPGPQILGWFMELTPEDKASDYVQLSGSEHFNKIIDALKDYRRNLHELRTKNESGLNLGGFVVERG